MKKIFTLLFAVAFLLTLAVPSLAAYNDTVGHWAENSIDYCTTRGLLSAVTAEEFAPDAPMSRAAFVNAIYRLAGEPAVANRRPFNDVAAGSEYARAVVWATSNGITDGYSTVKFGSDDIITREQMVTMLARYASLQGMDLSSYVELAGYSDGATVSSWAAEAMKWAVEKGIITPKAGNLLDPQGYASRALIADALMPFAMPEAKVVSESYVGTYGNMTDKFVITSDKVDLSGVKASDVTLKNALVQPYASIPSNGVLSVTYKDGALVIDVDDFVVFRCQDFILTIKAGKKVMTIGYKDLYFNNPDLEKFKECKTGGALGIPYRMYTPADTSAKLPLILWLHGGGERGSDNLMHLLSANTVSVLSGETVQKYQKCYVMAPQTAEGWTDAVLDEVVQEIQTMINDDKIDPTRVYVLGHSMGGAGTFSVLGKHPNMFAAAMPFSGGMRFEDNEKKAKLEAIASGGTAIWIIHAADDFVVPVKNSQDAYEQLKNAGANVYYSEIPAEMRYNHGSNMVLEFGLAPDDGHDDLYTWLFKQHRDSVVSKGYIGTYGRMTDKFVVTSDRIDLSGIKAENITIEKDFVQPYTQVLGKGVQSVSYSSGSLTIDVDDFVVYRSPDFVLTIKDSTGKVLKTIRYDDLYFDCPDLDIMKKYQTEGRNKIQYRLYEPDAGGKLPLILYLHGSGQQGNDNLLHIIADNSALTLTGDFVQKYGKSYVMAPQCPIGRRWDTEIVSELIDTIKAMIDAGKVDPDRVYVMGHSMGAMGTFRAVYDNPGFFAAAVPFAGSLIRSVSADELIKAVDTISGSKTNFWIVHAEDDFLVKVQESRYAFALLKETGCDVYYTEIPAELRYNHGANIKLAENIYPGGGHDDFYTWLFKQHRN